MCLCLLVSLCDLGSGECLSPLNLQRQNGICRGSSLAPKSRKGFPSPISLTKKNESVVQTPFDPDFNATCLDFLINCSANEIFWSSEIVESVREESFEFCDKDKDSEERDRVEMLLWRQIGSFGSFTC
ncbi:hypothetical protein CsSME_00031628 [Camellia sinensis var. sinensis]